MPAAVTPIVLLEKIDQLIIRRETDSTRMEEQLAEFDGTIMGRKAMETAIVLTKAALDRLASRRAEIVARDL